MPGVVFRSRGLGCVADVSVAAQRRIEHAARHSQALTVAQEALELEKHSHVRERVYHLKVRVEGLHHRLLRRVSVSVEVEILALLKL